MQLYPALKKSKAWKLIFISQKDYMAHNRIVSEVQPFLRAKAPAYCPIPRCHPALLFSW